MVGLSTFYEGRAAANAGYTVMNNEKNPNKLIHTDTDGGGGLHPIDLFAMK